MLACARMGRVCRPLARRRFSASAECAKEKRSQGVARDCGRSHAPRMGSRAGPREDSTFNRAKIAIKNALLPENVYGFRVKVINRPGAGRAAGESLALVLQECVEQMGRDIGVPKGSRSQASPRAAHRQTRSALSRPSSGTRAAPQRPSGAQACWGGASAFRLRAEGRLGRKPRRPILAIASGALRSTCHAA